MSLRGSQRRGPQDLADDDEREQEDPNPVEIAPRSIGEVLRGMPPAGRGTRAVLARSLRRLQGEQGNAAVARVLASREAAPAQGAGDSAQAGLAPADDAPAPEEPSAAPEPEVEDIPEEAIAAAFASAADRVAERIAGNAAAFTAVADRERDFLVLEVAQAAGTTGAQVQSQRQAARIGISDATLDGYAASSATPPGGSQIATAASDLLAHPLSTATIEGFTDDAGKPAANDSLSVRRAEEARAAIMAAAPGVPEDCFHIAGRGASEFVRPNLVELDRRRNRRVRIRVEEPAA